jgi:hypothetical protein
MKHTRYKIKLERQLSIHARQISIHARHLTNRLGNYTTPKKDAPVHILGAVKDCLNLYSMRAATREQAALHEVGHFVAFEVFGLGAYSASIKGTKFGRGGWCGAAQPLEERLNKWDTPTGNYLIAEAKIALAGAWAEELLGCGDAMSSTSEIIEAHLLIAKAAEMSGQDHLTLISQTLTDVTDFISQYEDLMRDLAVGLMKRKRITCFDRNKPREMIQAKMINGTRRGAFFDDRALQEEIRSLPVIAPLLKNL